MLFKRDTLHQIKLGKVSLAFRQWKKPTVKEGGTLLTPIGQLYINSIRKIRREEITDKDAIKAGFISLDELVNHLKKKEEISRIEFRIAGENPRIALRENDNMTPQDFENIVIKLKRMDASSKIGHWTARTLQLIGDRPAMSAGKLAAQLELEKDWLKPQIRKLKALGLTISLEVGYRLSPRGIAVLNMLKKSTVDTF